LLNPYHPLFRGVVGFAGHDTAIATLTDSSVDLVVAVGTSLGEWSSNGWDTASVLNKRLVHVESTINHFAASPMARLQLRGNIEVIFEEVCQRLDVGFTGKRGCVHGESCADSETLHFKLDD